MGIEDSIRNHLAANLGFINDKLSLIQKEFPLPNHIGSKGYIDLLAKDVFSNFVIIEIKRSKASSRETVQEILKYVGLLKQNFKARDSEIKIIILSTDWNELLVPFSELLYQTSLDVTGYKILLDDLNVPVGKEKINPVDVSTKRSIARSSFLHLFREDTKRKVCIDYIVTKCHSIGLKDFLLIKIFNSRSKNSNLEYQFALCFAFQALTIAEYQNIFNTANYEVDMEENEFDNESDFIHYLEQNIIVVIDAYNYHDTAESGSPEKLDSILGIQEWQVQQILRYGIFATDPRFNDEQLLRELRGLDGNSRIKYFNFGESSHTDRIEEVKQNCTVPLQYNPFWAKHIHEAFEYLSGLNKPFRFLINVYHPLSIFDTIWRAINLNNPHYLPIYLLFVDFINEDCLWIFAGRLSWNGKKMDLMQLTEYLTDDSDTFLNKFLDCVNGMHDDEILKQYNLGYENGMAEFVSDQMTFMASVRFENGKLIKFDSKEKSVYEWAQENKDVKELLGILYEKYTRNF